MFKVANFLFFFLISNCAFATSAIPAPHLPNMPEEAIDSPVDESFSPLIDEEILVDDMRGLILISDPSLIDPNPCVKEGVFFVDLEVPGGNEELICRLTPLFFHRPLTRSCIEALKREIVLYYRSYNRPLVVVLIPEQRIENHVLQLIVVESCLGNVIIEGNRFTSPSFFAKRISATRGGIINESLLIDDISWLNTNPFRRVNALFTPGECFGTTDIVLRVVERRPWRIYAGGDNTGTPQLGQQRFFIGANVANIFCPDNILSYQYTTSPNFRKLQAHTFQFAMPLTWRDTLSLFGGYSTAHPEIDLFHTDAKTSQISGRYSMPQWWLTRKWLEEFVIDIGYDYKTTNSNLFFGEDNILVAEKLVWINQFVGGVQFAFSGNRCRAQMGTELFWSPGQLTPHQKDEDFNALRPGATAHYFYGKLNFSYERILPWFLYFWGQGRIQLSNANLIASEQFSLGGYNTVRGYQERIVNGDNAYCFNLELRTQPFSLLSFCHLPKDSLIFLLFTDFGKGWDNEKIPGFPISQTLIGIGSGIRYHMGPWFSTRFDYAFPLHAVENEPLHGRLHFSLVFNY